MAKKIKKETLGRMTQGNPEGGRRVTYAMQVSPRAKEKFLEMHTAYRTQTNGTVGMFFEALIDEEYRAFKGG